MKYEYGLFISIAFVVFDDLHLLLRWLGSREFVNYRKISFYYSFWSGNFRLKSARPSFKWQLFSYLCSRTLVAAFALLSWVFVAYKLYFTIHRLFDLISMPEKIKKTMWAFCRTSPSKEELIRLHLKANNQYTEANARSFFEMIEGSEAA